jgi:ribosomal protection tetracycline resistance protein
VPARSLNLGILAHVDAGKTTLTERLLHLAGVIEEPGSVDAGTTSTDTLALERRRGITIKAAVVAFPLDGTTVNVLDTPGHPDFIAEVERVLGVLDGAVLVLSAVEGVQPQTRILMRALQRLSVPTLLFVNKIDRTGADVDATLAAVRRRLTPDVLPMGRIAGAGTRAATFTSYRTDDDAFRERETEALAEHDDALLASYVETGSGSRDRLRSELAAQTRACLLHPAYAGSAATGAGVADLMTGIESLLPTNRLGEDGEPSGRLGEDGEPSGRVFKIERGGAGEKIAYVRMFSGSLRARTRLDLPEGRVGKIAGLQLFDHGRWVRTDTIGGGQIGRLTGLSQVRVGDGFGRQLTEERHFPPPTLEASVAAVRTEQGPALRAALAELSDADPLIAARSDEDGQATVSLYGRVQQEVIASTLDEEYGIEVTFADASVLHVERPRGAGHALERLNTESNPFHATIGLTIAPGRPGSGLTFLTEAPARDMPLYVFKNPTAFSAAIERHVRDTLTTGLFGWRVTDCVVTLTDCGYSVADGPPSRRGPTSTAYDYRQLTPIVLRQALRRAGTVVCEPVLRVMIEIPNEATTAVQRVVTRWGAEVVGQTTGADLSQLEVRLVSTRLHELQLQLPDLTGGEGVLESRFDTFEPVHGRPPVRRGQRR